MHAWSMRVEFYAIWWVYIEGSMRHAFESRAHSHTRKEHRRPECPSRTNPLPSLGVLVDFLEAVIPLQNSGIYCRSHEICCARSLKTVSTSKPSIILIRFIMEPPMFKPLTFLTKMWPSLMQNSLASRLRKPKASILNRGYSWKLFMMVSVPPVFQWNSFGDPRLQYTLVRCVMTGLRWCRRT